MGKLVLANIEVKTLFPDIAQKYIIVDKPAHLTIRVLWVLVSDCAKSDQKKQIGRR